MIGGKSKAGLDLAALRRGLIWRQTDVVERIQGDGTEGGERRGR